MRHIPIDFGALGLTEISDPNEVTRGDLVKIARRGEPLDMVYEVLDVKGTSVILQNGDIYDFSERSNSRLFSVWSRPAEEMISEFKAMLTRAQVLKDSPRFDLVRLGRSYMHMLKMSSSLYPKDLEDVGVAVNRTVRVLWRWLVENKHTLWESNNPKPEIFVGRWDTKNMYVGLRPGAMLQIAEACDIGPAYLAYLLTRGGLRVRQGERSKCGPNRESCFCIGLVELRALAEKAGINVKEPV